MVAVHGLNGGSDKTWTHQKSGKMWLRDFLPKALPDVRIMTYGYDAKFVNFTQKQDLRGIATKLLTELVDFRTTEEVSKSE